MIRLIDTIVLAHTKLRVHKIRTGTAVGISGLLFGLIALVIIIAQGVFSSVDRFSEEGLNNRTILNVTKSGGMYGFNEYDSANDVAFVAEVEAAHKALVDKKKAAALKYGVSYQPEIEDPSPIGIDPETKQKVVKETALSDGVVQEIAAKKRAAAQVPFNIDEYIAKYSSATTIQKFMQVQPANGQLAYMKEGKEGYSTDPKQIQQYDTNTPTLSILESSLSEPFISNTAFDPSKGEIPVIVPYGAAEKLLKLPALPANAPMQQKYDRLKEVRSRVSEVTAQYCYRNNASQALLSQAVAQQKEIKAGESQNGYVKPSLIYTVPDEKSCGAITIASDTRSATEKRQASQYELFEKEIGTYVGEPTQQLVTVRGVGISSELESSGQWSLAELTKSLFASWLGYGTWVIPENLYKELPEDKRPLEIFGENNPADQTQNIFYGYESYLVEFTDKDQARSLLSASMANLSSDGDSVYATPFGSGILFVDEMRSLFEKALLWTFAIIGSIAVIILASIIGRTVSEGRRESAIFRAIGASRADIGSIYGMFVVLLSLRVVLFTAVLSIALALAVEILFWKDATLGARLAYAASDTTKEFHLFSLASPYLLWMVGVIVVVSIIAAVVPILLGARRNPIKDMRNDS